MKKAIKKHIKSILLAGVLIIICNALSTIHPYLIKQIIDIDFSSSNIVEVIIQFILAYTLAHIAFIVFKYLRKITTNKIVCKILKDIRSEVFNKVLNFKMITFNKYNSAELYTRLTDDIDNLWELFFGIINMVINNGTYILFMIIMMFIANVNLSLISLATLVLIAIVSIKFTKVLSKLDNEIMKKRDKENKEFSELYNKNKLTYLFKLQEKNVKKADELFYSELDTRKKYILVHSFPYWVLSIIQAIGIYAILYYALNIDISISLGTIYLILYYVKECESPLKEIFNQLEQLQTCFNSYKRIKVLLNETNDEIIEDGAYIENLNGNIEFKNVSMRYDKELILNDISLKIEKGTKVTIAGKTGAGKTTLTNVLMKLYDIENGQILIGDSDISKISTKCLRDNISYISQTPYIFSDTLRNNITLGDNQITDEQIHKLISEIGAEHIFNKLSEGLDSKIKLSKLSYGELQMIAFIRAILHKANIYIFDEPTSNIDLKTEKMIQNVIDKISETSTVIIIAHRKSTIEKSDKVIYLKDGKIDIIKNKEKV